MVEHPLSERTAWRSVWRLLLALSALLMAGWSVGASDRNPWTPAATAAVQPISPSSLVAVATDGAFSLGTDAGSRLAVWTPAVAGGVPAASVDRGATISGQTATAQSPQGHAVGRGGARAAEFDGLSIVLAVLALLGLVSWRRRDQLIR